MPASQPTIKSTTLLLSQTAPKPKPRSRAGRFSRIQSVIHGSRLARFKRTISGVPAVVVDDNIVQTNPFLTLAVGGVRVFVPESHAERAREIARAIERGDYALDDQKSSE
jgi:hypothetical protein